MREGVAVVGGVAVQVVEEDVVVKSDYGGNDAA